MKIRWDERPRKAASCPACLAVAPRTLHVVLVDAPGLPGRSEFLRCEACGSLTTGRLYGSRPGDRRLLSYYLEQGAAIDLMAEPLVRVPGARRLLEVGCGFGFALDFARHALGLEVRGVDPGGAAAAGAELLALPIAAAELDEGLDLGPATFDLALASEVVEHVPQPRPFLAALRARLADDGVVRLTTPDAACVAPASSEDQLHRALSPGHHAVLFTAPALAAALADAGLPHQLWESIPGTLRCWASPSAAGIARVTPPVDAGDALARYLAERAATVRPGSALELGLRYRHFKLAVNRGRHAEAEASLAALADALRRRHGLDLASPPSIVAALRAGGRRAAATDASPWCLPGVLFFLGMLELNGRGRAAEAESAFAAAAEAADRLIALETPIGVFDGETADLATQARVHRWIALARRDAAAAVDALEQETTGRDVLPAAALGRARAQLLQEAVASGALDAAARLHAVVAAAPPLDGDPALAAGTLLALGLLGLQRDRPAEAAAWLALGERIAADAGLATLGAALTSQREAARAHLAGAGPIAPEPPAAGFAPAVDAAGDGEGDGLDLAWALDAYWRDTHGVYLRGWLHAHERPVRTLRLRANGGDRAEVVLDGFAPRPDVAAHQPELPHVLRCGFAVHLATAAGTPLELDVETVDGGRATLPLELPAATVPPLPFDEDDDVAAIDRMLAVLAPGARVLMIGARYNPATPGERHPAHAAWPQLRFLGLDVHPGPGVDVVADAHSLGSLFRRGSLDAVSSGATLEHLAAPWLLAGEINRVLRRGGLVYHNAPYAWPAHAEPNDFWRFSADGLAQLFGEATGFEVILARNFQPLSMVPVGRWRERHLEMPLLPGYGGAEILARKVRDLGAGEVAWPLVDAARRARAYPVAGVAEHPDLRWTERRER